MNYLTSLTHGVTNWLGFKSCCPEFDKTSKDVVQRVFNTSVSNGWYLDSSNDHWLKAHHIEHVFDMHGPKMVYLGLHFQRSIRGYIMNDYNDDQETALTGRLKTYSGPLEFLSFSKSNIDDKEMIRILEAIKSNAELCLKLRGLDLRNTAITDITLTYIRDNFLDKLTNLAVISLGGWPLGSVGVGRCSAYTEEMKLENKFPDGVKAIQDVLDARNRV